MVDPTAPADSGPVEKKVTGALGGGATGYAIAGLILFALNQWVYTGDRAVPAELSGPLLVLVPLVLTLVGGYITPHTWREDPDALDAAVKAGALRSGATLPLLPPEVSPPGTSLPEDRPGAPGGTIT